MKFFFGKWKLERHYDSFDRIESIEYSTYFTVDGVPFSAVFDALIDSDIYIYHEPEHTEVTVVCNELKYNKPARIENLIKIHFEDAVALADLSRNEKLKHMEEAQ